MIILIVLLNINNYCDIFEKIITQTIQWELVIHMSNHGCQHIEDAVELYI